jgi:tryptophanyl-tRNA synthetase
VSLTRAGGYIEGVGRIILPEPESLLTKASKMPGLDGQKMSKQPIFACTQPSFTQSQVCSSEYTLCNCQTGHFSGSPASVSLTLTLGDRERLLGYIEGVGRIILPEPESLLTKASKMPGLDGQKMSKSYGNTI